jgi:hypothetical protein
MYCGKGGQHVGCSQSSSELMEKSLNQTWLARYPRIIRLGYGDYRMLVNLNPNNGCLILLAIPLIPLLFPK